MQLEEFYDYKNQLMGDLLTNKNIVSLLDSDINPEDAERLVFTQVFPCEYIPETVEHGKTFICFDVDVQEANSSKTFLYPVLYVWVFTHKSKLRLKNGEGVRTDKLCVEICKAINGSRDYGLGELMLYSVKRFAPMTDFNGKLMTFHAKDFNMLYNPQKHVPSNRKTG